MPRIDHPATHAPRYRSPGNYDSLRASRETWLDCSTAGPSLTNQADGPSADINRILSDFGITGKLPVVAMPPTYDDFSECTNDYQTALELINAANASFMQLDAKTRATFDNNPAQFVDFCSDPANLPEMRKMGLAIDNTAEAAGALLTPTPATAG